MATTQIPDGKGGWTEIEGTAIPGDSADAARQRAALEEAYMKEVGNLTIQLAKFAQAYCKDQSLTPQHLADAVSLLGINCRQTYPDGIKAYDERTKAMWAHYEKEEPKLAAKVD